MATSIADFVAKYRLIVDTILASGPDVQADLDDLKAIVDASQRIYDRTIKRFGLSADDGSLTAEQLVELEDHPDVKAANEKLSAAVGHGSGVKGPFADVLVQLVQLIASNPALLTLILSLFKKTP